MLSANEEEKMSPKVGPEGSGNVRYTCRIIRSLNVLGILEKYLLLVLLGKNICCLWPMAVQS